MRNIKSVNKIMADTGDKYTAKFISELLFKFSNLTGTQVNSIKNILTYNNIEDMSSLVDHINNCFNYEGSKSSGDYKKFMYGDEGYEIWLAEFNESRAKSKEVNQQDPNYVKNMYCKTMCKEVNNIRDVDFVYELVKDYIPLNETNRDIIIRVLKLNRFDTIEEYQDNIKQLSEYKGSRSNNNREYGVILLGEQGYADYMNNSVSLSKQVKRDNFLSNIDSDERYVKHAKTMIKTYEICDYDEEFIVNVIRESKSFELDSDTHKRWLGDQLNYTDLVTVSDHANNVDAIINFKGSRKHSIEWDTLRFGAEEANNRHLISGFILTSVNNPNYVEMRTSPSTKEEKIKYIKSLFDKESEYYISKDSIKFDQTFYIVQVDDDVYKVGITRNFKKRFNHNRYNKAVMVYQTNVYEALVLEIVFKILYGNDNTDDHEGFGYTETFGGLTEEVMIDRFNKIKKMIDNELRKEA